MDAVAVDVKLFVGVTDGVTVSVLVRVADNDVEGVTDGDGVRVRDPLGLTDGVGLCDGHTDAVVRAKSL